MLYKSYLLLLLKSEIILQSHDRFCWLLHNETHPKVWFNTTGHGFLCWSVQVCTFLLLWLCVSGGLRQWCKDSILKFHKWCYGSRSRSRSLLWSKAHHFLGTFKKIKWKRSNTANNFQKSINLVISIRKACHWLLKNRNILLDWFHNQYCMNTPFKFYPWWSVLQGNCCSKTGISYSNDFIISTAWTHLLSFTLSGQRYRVTVVQKQEYPAGLIS